MHISVKIRLFRHACIILAYLSNNCYIIIAKGAIEMKKTFARLIGSCGDLLREPCPDPKAQLVDDIKQTRQKLDAAYSRFEYECDGDLVQSVIFEIESLKAQYSYLLKLAREQGVECAAITVFN